MQTRIPPYQNTTHDSLLINIKIVSGGNNDEGLLIRLRSLSVAQYHTLTTKDYALNRGCFFLENFIVKWKRLSTEHIEKNYIDDSMRLINYDNIIFLCADLKNDFISLLFPISQTLNLFFLVFRINRQIITR